MALIDCVKPEAAIGLGLMGNEPWQQRLKRAGMTQKEFAELLGMSANAISAQLRGDIAGGTSRYVKVAILALERLLPSQRDEIINELQKDD